MDQQNSAQPSQPTATPPAQPESPAAPVSPAPATPPSAAAPAAGTPAAAPAMPSASPAPAATPSAGSANTMPAKKSSHKVLLAILALAILVGGGVVAYQMSAGKVMYQGETMQKQSQSKVTTVPSPTVGAVKSGDAQLDQQSDAIDTSMDKLNSDVSNVDKGLQDQADTLN